MKLTHTNQRRKRRHSAPQGGGSYTTFARALGVSIPHLWMVLNGQRVSASLTARYTALRADAPALATPTRRRAA